MNKVELAKLFFECLLYLGAILVFVDGYLNR